MPENKCPRCGAPLLDDALGGHCPHCVPHQGLTTDAIGSDPGSTDETVDQPPKAGSVLERISTTVNAVPRVLLRDMAIDEESSPIVHPMNDLDPSLRYRIEGEIASGGMGSVLKGRDPDLGRDVAIKVLRDDLRDNGDLVHRFVEEAQIGGQLQHPGVVPIYELGAFADQRPFFSMKLVKGQTLAKLLKARQSPADDLPRFLSIYAAIAQTMAYAHTRCVIHRDLKPLNVMVGAFGEVLVMDWGLAKVLPHGGVADDACAGQQSPAESVIATARSESATDLSQPGSILGTPGYMPPEQARGESDLINMRADVFALGSILCEILTGAPAFTGRKSDEVIRKTARGDTSDALGRLHVCRAEAELIALAQDCLAVEPEDRPRDANIVSERITAYLAGVQERLRAAELARAAESARAEEAIVRVGAERRARRFQVGLAASILLAMTLGGGGWLWVKNERDARLAQVTRDINDALNKVTEFRAQARTTTVGGTQLFAKAREQAQAALVLVRNNPVDDRLEDQVTSLWTELEGEEEDRALLAALDAASLAQVELSENKSRLDSERAVPLFREAFRAYGLPAGEGEAKAVAGRIGQRPKAVREAIIAALDDWDALAGNPTLGIIEPHRAWIQAVLAAAEPAEGWTGQFRAARGEKDLARREAALEKLAAADEVETLPARALPRLASQLTAVGAHASAERLLRRAQQRYPADFWVNAELGGTLQHLTPPQFDEAVRYLTAAVALRPESSAAHHNLGVALHGKGRLDEAIATYRGAIELDPKFAMAHDNLGRALRDKGQVDEAIAEHRAAIELDPRYAMAYHNLGVSLKAKGQVDEAIAAYRKTIEINPRDAAAHVNLGNALDAKGQVDEAIAAYRKAIELDPKLAMAHVNLGNALRAKGQVDEAIAVYRKAIEVDPKLTIAHYNLGVALKAKGQVNEAIAAYRKAIEVDPRYAAAHYNLGVALHDKSRLDEAIATYRGAIELDPKLAAAHVNLGVALKAKGQVDEAIAAYCKAIEVDPKLTIAHYNLGAALQNQGKLDEAVATFRRAAAVASPGSPLAQALPGRIRKLEQQIALAGRLPGILKGDDQPRDNAERLAFAQVCYDTKRHATAARLWAEALQNDPRLGDDRQAQHRYNAACAAALAAAGQGKEEPKPDDAAKLKLREQVRVWLEAELAAWSKLRDTQPQARPFVPQALQRWRVDSDLAAVRDVAALARLPEAERKEWQTLWAEVERLLKSANSAGK